MKKALIKGLSILAVSGLLLQVTGCGQTPPVRNPFAGRQEPKMGDLPELSAATKSPVVANVAWTNGTLAKQEYFTKLKPYVTAQVVYGADHSGKVVALDANTGKKLWNISTGKKWIAGPTLFENKLLLTTKDAMLVALDASDGHQLWEAKVSSEVLAPPTGSQGIVLVHAIDGAVSAINANNGSPIWRVDQSMPSLSLHYSSSPVIAGNSVLVGFASGKLQAFDLRSGLVEWERAITQPRGRSELQRMVDISADPVVVGDTAYAINYQGKLAAVDVKSGNIKWEREISSYQNIAADDRLLYVTDTTHQLWAIDQQSGKTYWKQDALHDRYITGPAVVKGNVVVADRGGYLHFIDSRDGHLLSRLHVRGKYYQEPIVQANGLCLRAQNGKIAAVHLDNGSMG